MIYLRQLTHLAKRLAFPLMELEQVAQSTADYCDELLLIDPAKPGKERSVLNVRGPFRRIQNAMYRRLLLPTLKPLEFSHGGVPHRDIKSNISPHLSSTFVFTTDISDFFPTIHNKRVYKLFTERFKCCPDVAHVCTKLCTYKHQLALGLITSPILADQILRDIDKRIGAACKKENLVYTRYIDDVTISGPFNLQRSGFAHLVESILSDHGFVTNQNKSEFGATRDGITVTNLRIKNGHPDVTKKYVAELERQLDDASNLATGRAFHGPYYTPGQIRGRVQFVCWINPGRKRQLKRKFCSIPWDRVETEAKARNYVALKKTVRRSLRKREPCVTT